MPARPHRYWTLFFGLALVWGAGCTFDPSGPQASPGDGSAATPDGLRLIDAAGLDAAPADARLLDAPPRMPDAACPGDVLSFSPSNFNRCDVPAPPAGMTSLDVPTAQVWTIDTDGSGTLTDGAGTTIAPLGAVIAQKSPGPDILIVSFSSVHVADGGTLRVTGSRPLAMVSLGDITVDGLLDAGAKHDVPGPGGSDRSVCGDGTHGTDGTGHDGAVEQHKTLSGGAGGGGGGYGGGGGDGAGVNAADNDVTTPGGASNGGDRIVPLRGGCSGGGGGNGGGAGGGGGGGLQLVAKGTITVHATGAVSVAGGGGGGVTTDSSGGGGGGSGGAVLLEAGRVQIDGAVTANGGGGGEGARRHNGTTGSGEDGHPTDATAAQGGTTLGNPDGGDGGDGGAGSTAAAAGSEGNSDTSGFSQALAGGGGGGGAVGRIHFNSQSSPAVTGVVSPAEK